MTLAHLALAIALHPAQPRSCDESIECVRHERDTLQVQVTRFRRALDTAHFNISGAQERLDHCVYDLCHEATLWLRAAQDNTSTEVLPP